MNNLPLNQLPRHNHESSHQSTHRTASFDDDSIRDSEGIGGGHNNFDRGMHRTDTNTPLPQVEELMDQNLSGLTHGHTPTRIDSGVVYLMWNIYFTR